MSDQLEKEFKTLLGSVGKQIQAKVDQAEKLMKEACQMADQYGLPFETTVIDDMRGWYIPESFGERFAALDIEVAMDLTDISQYKLQRANGWQRSDIC